MKHLALALLLFAQEDKAADLIFTTLSATIRGAKTIRAEVAVTVGSGGRQFGILTASIKARGADHWSMEFSLKDEIGRGRQSRTVTLLSDGRKVVAPAGEGPPGMEALKPEEVGKEIRESFILSMISQAMYIEPHVQEDAGAKKPPERGPVTSAGKEKIGERDSRILEYSLKYERAEFKGQSMTVKLWVDEATHLPLKREVTFQGILWTETFSVFKVDEELADSEFSFQSKARLAAARAGQIADSVGLYGKFTGRQPASLGDLTTRPASLEPEVFWPPGGFVLGGAVPSDPWGRPYELRAGKEGVQVVSAGEPGKGKEVAVAVPPVTRRAVGAPSERLKNQFAARVQIQLLAASVRAFQSSYGELPKKKAALWERPEWAEVWPDGGFAGGPGVPNDPWGEAYRVITEPGFVRIQVNDPKRHLLLVKALTPEERKLLDAAAEPRLTEAERGEIARVFDALGDDDLETREKAEVRLRSWGAAAAALLEARIKVEKDKEAKLRLEAARASIPKAPAPWMSELGGLSVMSTRVQSIAGEAQVNERNAAASLKTLASAEADFRANDRDGNHVNDFWVGDVAGLFTLKDDAGNSIKLIELSVALADGAPLEAGAAAGRYVAGSTFGAPGPKAGYHYRVMTHDASSGKSEPYATETGLMPNLGKVYNTSTFGFCCYPAEYGSTGQMTYIINEGNTIFCRDTQGEPVLEWPSDADLRDWKKLD